MAENESERPREDLTEEASPYRIEEFRRKGIVAQSRELSGLLALLAAVVTLYVYSTQIGREIAEFMRLTFQADMASRLDFADTSSLRISLGKALKVLIYTALPICIAGFLIGIFGSFAQIGSIFSWEPMTPDLEKINPIKGMKRLFSLRQLIEGLRAIFKLALIGFVAFLLIKAEILKSPGYLLSDPLSILFGFGQTGKILFFAFFGVLIFFAALDFGLQRWEFSKNIRMTKQEAKQELKEREGDPQIKARIRSIQREMARRRMMQAVKKADVIITNPTHIAVAIAYQKEKMFAPKVIAKGADFLAQKIKQIASEAGVPQVENVPLARTLYKTVKVGQNIPRVLYQAVAEVLAYVYRLKNRRL